MYKLLGNIKQYNWGKSHDNSIITKLFSKTANSIETDKPIAEIWFGTHPLGESITDGGKSLSAILKEGALECLNADSKTLPKDREFNLPFLSKFLSINKPLSIQAHPDIQTAIKLNLKDPKNYPDQNHKPEIAIALTNCSLLSGFKTGAEISNDIANNSKLLSLIPKQIIDDLKTEKDNLGLKNLVSHIINNLTSEDSINIISHLKKSEKRKNFEDALLNAANYFPAGDIGLFFFYILNFIELAPLEAIFNPPNTPHAYLSGEMFECMALSDNVVRVGLTDKFIDQESLLSILNYSPNQQKVIIPNNTTQCSEYDLKDFIDEFSTIRIFKSGHLVKIDNSKISLVFCLQGEMLINNTHFCQGEVGLVNKKESYLLDITKEDPSNQFNNCCAIIVS